MNVVVNIIVPTFICVVILVAFLQKKDVLKLFTDGVSEGLKTVINIFPHILAITIAITLMRETGLLTFVLKPIQGLLVRLGISEGIVPLMLFRPFSGGAATSIAMDIFKRYGADSFEGKVASIIMGGTETTFYVLTILVGTVKIKKIRGVLIAALVADVVAMITAIIIVNFKLI